MCVCVGNGECLFSILDLAQKFLLFRSIHLGSHIYIYIYTYIYICCCIFFSSLFFVCYFLEKYIEILAGNRPLIALCIHIDILFSDLHTYIVNIVI